jgi:hypothetical protein
VNARNVDPLGGFDRSGRQREAECWRTLVEMPETAPQAGAALAGLREIEGAVLVAVGKDGVQDARRVILGYESFANTGSPATNEMYGALM